MLRNEQATREQLRQLADLRGPFEKRTTVYIDLSRVEAIDACALLHLIAQARRLTAIPLVTVMGNYPAPQHQRALRVMLDAHFDELIGAPPNLRGPKQRGQLLKVSHGRASERMSPRAWMPVYEFLKLHGKLTEEETENLYNAVSECVENVKLHAYESRPKKGPWYALALLPTDDEAARLVVVDIGDGIPASIRGGQHEESVLRKFFGFFQVPLEVVLRALKDDDWACVQAATRGLRTRTSDEGRGTGLNGLREGILGMKGGSLHVLSGAASVTWDHTGVEPRRNEHTLIDGTVVCLTIGAPLKTEAQDER